MFKLVFFLVGLGIALIISALNLGNMSDISLGFVKFTDVPVFLSIFTAFLAGAVFTLPFAFHVSMKHRKEVSKKKKKVEYIEDEIIPEPVNPVEKEL